MYRLLCCTISSGKDRKAELDNKEVNEAEHLFPFVFEFLVLLN